MRESQVERRKGEKMSKVIRLSDYTEELLKQYKEYTKELMEKYELNAELLIRSDDQLVQAALLRALRKE